MTNPPKINLAVWRSGDWLSDALEIHAPIRVKRAKADVLSNSAWINKLDISNENQAQMQLIGSSLNAVADKFSRNAERRIKQVELVIEKLMHEELIAIGFYPDALFDTGPALVPVHLFRPDFIKWNKNEIKSPYLHFMQVKILRPQSINASPPVIESSISVPLEPQNNSPPERAGQKNKPGPKPVGDEIRRIYALLKDNGTIPKKHTVKEAWIAFLAYLENHPSDSFKNGRGQSYPTFSREIGLKTDG